MRAVVHHVKFGIFMGNGQNALCIRMGSIATNMLVLVSIVRDGIGCHSEIGLYRLMCI